MLYAISRETKSMLAVTHEVRVLAEIEPSHSFGTYESAFLDVDIQLIYTELILDAEFYGQFASTQSSP